MSNNKTLLGKKLPYVDTFTSTESALNYIVKTINSTFQQEVPPVPSLGVSFTQSYNSGGGSTLISNYTFDHNLNALPTGFLITNNVHPITTGASDSFTLVSWTPTQITVRISINTGGAAAVGSFTILVLR